MTLQDIIDRLTSDGYTNCSISGKQVLLPGLGEVELAHGEAKIFDAKYAWPDYGGHQCHKSIDALFEDIHNTWPLEPACETSLPESEPSSEVSPPATEIAIKDDVLVIVTGEENDPEPVEPESVQASTDAPPVCVGVDAEREAEVRS